jgi:hypothetical protein
VVYLFSSFLNSNTAGCISLKKTFALLHSAYIPTAREAVTVNKVCRLTALAMLRIKFLYLWAKWMKCSPKTFLSSRKKVKLSLSIARRVVGGVDVYRNSCLTWALDEGRWSNFTFMWPCSVTNFFSIKTTDSLISQIYFVKKLYMFRAVPLLIIRSFPMYIRHWSMSCSFDDSFQARLVVFEGCHQNCMTYMSCNFDDIYQCRMYSGKLLRMSRRTARNMRIFLTK